MNATRLLVRNDARALLGVWLAVGASLLVGEVPGLPDFSELAVVAYVAGAAALGAMSIGHEYRHGTLSLLLAQPVSRGRLLAVKIGVLLAMLAGLAALARIFPLAHVHVGAARTPLLVLPILFAVSVAPWITLKTGNVVAGAILTGSLGSLLFIGSYVWALARGVAPRDMEAARIAFVWAGSAVMCVAGAIALCTTFMRLDVSDGPAAGMHLPAFLRGDGAARERRGVSSPVLLLVGKELRLQQLTYAASLFSVCGFVAATVARPAYLPRHELLMVMPMVHAIVIAMMIGALASAEERALGTHEWQLLQPMSARAQFAVKLAVVMGLTLVLSFGLPAVMSLVSGGAIEGWPPNNRLAAASVFLVLTSASLYISSLSTSGLTALLLCIPAFLAVQIFMRFVVERVSGRGALAIHPVFGWAFVALLLWLAFRNHRESGPSLRRAATQLAGLAIVVTAFYTASGLAARVLWRA